MGKIIKKMDIGLFFVQRMVIYKALSDQNTNKAHEIAQQKKTQCSMRQILQLVYTDGERRKW